MPTTRAECAQVEDLYAEARKTASVAEAKKAYEAQMKEDASSPHNPGNKFGPEASRGQGEGHHPRPGQAQGLRQEVQAGGSGGPRDPHLHRGRLQVHQSGGRQPEGPSRAAEARRRRQADRLDGRAAPARPFQGQERDRAQAIGEGARRVRGGQEEEPGGGRRAARRHGDGGVQEAAEEDRARSIAAPA